VVLDKTTSLAGEVPELAQELAGVYYEKH